MRRPLALNVPVEAEGEEEIGNSQNEGVLPPRPVPVRGRLCQFVEGWKHVTYDNYVLSIVAKGYRLRFTSSPLLLKTPWEIKSPQGPQKIQGMREQISGVRRVASSNSLKTTERSHLRPSLSYPHYRLSAEYHRKRRLRIQNRSAGCVLSCTNINRQQEVPTFCLQPQDIPVPSTSLHVNTASQVFTCLGHTVAACLHRQGILVIPYLHVWLIHHPDCQALLFHESLDFVGLKLNEAKSELDPIQDIQFLILRLLLDQGRASLPVSKALGIIAGTCQISSQSSLVVHSSVLVHGVIQLGFRSYPTGSSAPSQQHFHSLGLTNWFIPLRLSDPLVLVNLLNSSICLYLPLESLSDLSMRSSRFLQMPLPRAGAPIWGIPRFQVLGPVQTTSSLQFGAQGGNFGPPPLGFIFTGPPSYDHYRQNCSSVLHQQTGRDPFPHPLTSSSGSIPMFTYGPDTFRAA